LDDCSSQRFPVQGFSKMRRILAAGLCLLALLALSACSGETDAPEASAALERLTEQIIEERLSLNDRISNDMIQRVLPAYHGKEDEFRERCRVLIKSEEWCRKPEFPAAQGQI
jgi:hypothetical protein